jgi:hypothetical protein
VDRRGQGRDPRHRVLHARSLPRRWMPTRQSGHHLYQRVVEVRLQGGGKQMESRDGKGGRRIWGGTKANRTNKC